MSVATIVALVALVVVAASDRSKRWIIGVAAVAGAVLALTIPIVGQLVHMIPGV